MTRSHPLSIPCLFGTCVRLRPFTTDDAATVSTLLSAPEISAATLNIPHPSPDEAGSWIATYGQCAQAGTSLTWAIVRRRDDLLMGAITLGITPEHRRGSLGFWLGTPYWNQGYMSDAARTVIAFALDELRLHRVQGSCFPRNFASSRVMEKAGLTFEGVLRSYIVDDGVSEDLAMYARIAHIGDVL